MSVNTRDTEIAHRVLRRKSGRWWSSSRLSTSPNRSGPPQVTTW
ncbi:hypothetical protein [Streptosporangium sandarakinum]